MEQMVHPGQLGQAIRHLRVEKGYTQKNLARKAGVSAQ